MSLIGRDEAVEILKGSEGLNRAEAFGVFDVINKLENDKQQAELRAEEYKQILSLRKSWSKWILIAVCVIIFSDVILIFFIGAGWLKFTNDIVVPFFIGESFLKTIGLALIIVNFLFKKPMSQ